MPEEARNELGDAISPYLLQHRDNPVHWRQWSPDAMTEAKRSNRPILLSIGYAACHWCHVMAHESFEDRETAALMNRLFVNVKIDREERPDLDAIYMAALHAMGEQGGWPLTMVLTPEGEPFFGGTYFPPSPRFGRPSFGQVLEAVSRAWETREGEMRKAAGAMAGRLAEHLSATAPAGAIDRVDLTEAADRIASLIDRAAGGMRGAPKFPNAPYLEILARSGFPAGPRDHRDAFLTTLRALCEGGIYDHLGGGLHRYATDERWLVPHFEKMLYDNAAFLRHLVWGHRATAEPLFAARIRETAGWLEREIRLPGGGLSSSLDADSADETGHMEEGAFYAWRLKEAETLLGPRFDAFARAYDLTPGGNWEGRTVLHRRHAGAGEWRDDWLGDERRALLQAREARARPSRDDKVLADWNGLAIRALAEVGTAGLGEASEAALRLARGAFDFVCGAMVEDGRLVHAWREGRRAGCGLSSDYGAMIQAGVALFAATLDRVPLARATEFAEALELWHGDGAGGHFLTARDANDVLTPLRGDSDDAVTSGTGLVVEALAMLAQATGEAGHLDRALRAGQAAAGRAGAGAAGFPGIVAGIDRLRRGSELALFGFRSNPGFDAMVAAMRGHVDLNRLDIVGNDPARLPAGHALALADPERLPAAYLCRDGACRPPVFDAASLAALLGG